MKSRTECTLKRECVLCLKNTHGSLLWFAGSKQVSWNIIKGRHFRFSTRQYMLQASHLWAYGSLAQLVSRLSWMTWHECLDVNQTVLRSGFSQKEALTLLRTHDGGAAEILESYGPCTNEEAVYHEAVAFRSDSLIVLENMTIHTRHCMAINCSLRVS